MSRCQVLQPTIADTYKYHGLRQAAVWICSMGWASSLPTFLLIAPSHGPTGPRRCAVLHVAKAVPLVAPRPIVKISLKSRATLLCNYDSFLFAHPEVSISRRKPHWSRKPAPSPPLRPYSAVPVCKAGFGFGREFSCEPSMKAQVLLLVARSARRPLKASDEACSSLTRPTRTRPPRRPGLLAFLHCPEPVAPITKIMLVILELQDAAGCWGHNLFELLL